MAETLFTTARGTFELVRPHTVPASPLRAWTAADLLVLTELAGDLGRVLVVNDEFGALTVALADTDIVTWTDSALSRLGAEENLRRNGLEAAVEDRVLRGHREPTGRFDTVIVTVPKSLALLRHQLERIRTVCDSRSRVIGAGMARHIQRSTVAAFEELIGTTVTSRAWRKARLIHSSPTNAAVTVASSMAGSAATEQEPSVFVTDRGITVAEAPGTFSAGHIDEGSALLIEVLFDQPSDRQPAGQIADLGCGNGVLSAALAKNGRKDATFSLFDASDLAIWAAQRTWQLNELSTARAAFVAADSFADAQAGAFDAVITNPPFHQGHARDPELTDRLMADAAQVLRPGGELWLVAQRHLNMHTRLKRWFTNIEVLSKHPRYVVLRAAAAA